MDIKEFELWDDIKRIIGSNEPGTYSFSMVLHAPKDELEVLGIISLDITSDYDKNYTDLIQASIVVPIGDFVHRIMPWKELLEVSLEIKDIEARYRVILPNDVLEYSLDMYNNQSMAELNTKVTEVINIQLVPLHAEPVRMASCRGVYSGTLDEIIPEIMTSSMDISVEGMSIANKVEMQEADNKTKFDQLIIPTGLATIDLVPYIQEKYGIYYRGANRFLTWEDGATLWKIYDLYNPLRRDKDTTRAKIRCFLVPPGVNIPMTTTWMEEDDVFSFIGTTSLEESNSLDSRLPNRPLGFSYQTQDKLVGGDIKVDAGIPYGSSDHVAKRAIMYSRMDGIVDRGNHGNTSNKFKLTSGSMENLLSKKLVTWYNSNPHFILPGDTLNLYTVDNMGEIKQYLCAISGQRKIFSQESPGITDNVMTCTTILSLSFIKRL